MSRAPRRLALGLSAAACLTGATLPAAAATVTPDPKPVEVLVAQAEGSRVFSVLDMQDDPLTRLDFRTDADGALPFQTVVTDQALHLDTPGYQVSAVMSNLYRLNGTETTPSSFADRIDSSDISLGFGAPLSVPRLALPVDPDVLLAGALRECDATGLGVSAAALLTDTTLAVLCPLLGNLVSLDVPAGTVADGQTQVVDLAGLTLASGGVLDLASLPFALTGQQQIGPFTSPDRYELSASVDDGVDPAQATVKRVMTGTPSLLGTVTGLVDTVLATRVSTDALDVLPSDATPSLVTDAEVLSALRDAPTLTTVVNLIDDLTPAQVRYLLGDVTGTIAAVVEGQLSTLDAEYVGNPVLQARPTSTRPGSYTGQLTVTFFQE